MVREVEWDFDVANHLAAAIGNQFSSLGHRPLRPEVIIPDKKETGGALLMHQPIDAGLRSSEAVSPMVMIPGCRSDPSNWGV